MPAGRANSYHRRTWPCAFTLPRAIVEKHRHDRSQPHRTATPELEAAAFRTLVHHLQTRKDVQNIDLMNLAGFAATACPRYKAAADDLGVEVSNDQAREEIYGMPYAEWKAKYQKEASPEQQAAFAKSQGNA